MAELRSWSETAAGMLSGRAAFPGDDRADRAELRAEQQREERRNWEQQMDAADDRLRAEGRLDKPWRVQRGEAEARAAEGAMLEVPNSHIRFRPANWIMIGYTRPPELEPLFLAAEARKVRHQPLGEDPRRVIAEQAVRLPPGLKGL